jgi:imidazolonepropionase-like amidohydrolase
MELLEEAGIPRAEIIVAATSRAATMIGQSKTIGSIEVGKYADMIILASDPNIVGMKSLRDINYVIVDGDLQTPTEWTE